MTAKLSRPMWCGKSLSRGADAAECPKCGGYAEKMKTVPASVEREALAKDCGRDWMCCTAAFQCKKCKQIVLAHLEAPEME